LPFFLFLSSRLGFIVYFWAFFIRAILLFNATFIKNHFSCHAVLDRLDSQSLTVKGGSKRRRILKAKGQNQTRPARYRARNPPQFSGRCRLYSAGAAINFITWTKKNPRRNQPAGAISMD